MPEQCPLVQRAARRISRRLQPSTNSFGSTRLSRNVTYGKGCARLLDTGAYRQICTGGHEGPDIPHSISHLAAAQPPDDQHARDDERDDAQDRENAAGDDFSRPERQLWRACSLALSSNRFGHQYPPDAQRPCQDVGQPSNRDVRRRKSPNG
jgi:hypothetical protein